MIGIRGSACVLGIALAFVSFPRAATAAPSRGPSPSAHESPFACDRMALGPRERRQHFDVLGPALRARRTATRELPDGYEFGFPSDAETVHLLETWMEQERRCCPFFDLSLTLDREGGPAWLRLGGRQGVKEFVRAEFPDAWFTTPSK